jgi:hypothetical protein
VTCTTLVPTGDGRIVFPGAAVRVVPELLHSLGEASSVLVVTRCLMRLGSTCSMKWRMFVPQTSSLMLRRSLMPNHQSAPGTYQHDGWIGMQVGAGDGRLTWHLKQLLDHSAGAERPTSAGDAVTDIDGVVLSSRVECRACDNGARPGLSEPSYAGRCSLWISSPTSCTSSLASLNGRRRRFALALPRRCPASPLTTATPHPCDRLMAYAVVYVVLPWRCAWITLSPPTPPPN